MLHIKRPAALGERPAPTSVTITTGFWDGAENSPSQFSRLAIRAELTGSHIAMARGITARSSTPVLALCRQLIVRGFDPALPLHAYRGSTLALIVRSIGEGARIEINAYGTGFRPRREADAGPSVRKSELGAS
jgi:hypothetical protein